MALPQKHNNINRSLSFRVGLIITLTQLVMLSIIGVLYFNNFSAEVDLRIRENALQPLQLINSGVLELQDLTNQDQLKQLIGEDIVNAFVVGVNDNIFFSLNSEYLGQQFSSFPYQFLQSYSFTDLKEPTLFTDETGHVVSVSPLVGEDGRSVRFYGVLEISLERALTQKTALIQLFALGTLATVVVTSLVIYVVFNATIFTRIRTTLTALERVASGNLKTRLPNPSHDEIGVLQTGINTMITRLEDLFDTLEDQVAERTHDLSVSATVSRQITTVLNRKELLDQLVQLTLDSFKLYHVNIYLFDEGAGALKLLAATGEAGRQMIAQERQYLLDANRGLVPLAARTLKAAVVNDVTVDAAHNKNDLLDRTMSEAAIPLRFGDELIGVLDLQSEKKDRFGATETELFTSLGDQIATALRNAKLFEQVEEQSLRAQQADQAKSAFLASTSHELRTPLNAIINLTSFVRRGMMGVVTPRQEEMLSLVMQSGQNLLSLINDVLDMSKIESGSLKLYIEPNLDLYEVILNASATAQSLLNDKPVKLTLDISDSLPLLSMDKNRIQQVMLNILSNACKFTESGEIRIEALSYEDEIRVSISDTGAGIAPEDHHKVFEKFAQTESGLRQGGGTGLGMPITKSLVEAHGGRLWLESEMGTGSTFFFTLPIQRLLIHLPEEDEKNQQV